MAVCVSCRLRFGPIGRLRGNGGKTGTMGLLKSLGSWDARAAASIGANQELIDLQAKRIRLQFESLKKQGFTEDQALQIVCSMAEGAG